MAYIFDNQIIYWLSHGSYAHIVLVLFIILSCVLCLLDHLPLE